ncbi:Phosphoglycerate mutase 2, co-factor independent [Alteracholeplasma palmae J233]|uniref:Phosphoglycerate mutase 2, co-factor independent n=1 Tax=Alteracholeplasma palmae (strain ATCC 49389 / J233) TaxID=1318466 RepID=U4KKX1_ALTPJ|nr:histidine phosphatase family protein [Alteracholeplasma palmae]CCV64459.1 Phosphoglycerate mutase 2, co-factor independent [Alteracholeplasma palmae J233]
MIIGLVRHGQTDFNKKGIIQGHIDNPLNKEGINQVKKLGIHLKQYDKSWDYIGYTPLKRAYESATILNSFLNIKLSFAYKKLIERDFGPFDGKDVSVVKDIFKQKDYKVEGFENDSLLLERVKNALFELNQKYTDKKVLFVCHSHVIKSALILVDPKTYSFMNYYVSNSSIYYFDISESTIKFIKKIDLE